MSIFYFQLHLLKHSQDLDQTYRVLKLGLDKPPHAIKTWGRFREHTQNEHFLFSAPSFKALTRSWSNSQRTQTRPREAFSCQKNMGQVMEYTKMSIFSFWLHLLKHSQDLDQTHRGLKLGLEKPPYAIKTWCRFREHTQNEHFLFSALSFKALTRSWSNSQRSQTMHRQASSCNKNMGQVQGTYSNWAFSLFSSIIQSTHKILIKLTEVSNYA
jgi:pyruvate dehydrogenase complex dehydrogenase (E1) component